MSTRHDPTTFDQLNKIRRYDTALQHHREAVLDTGRSRARWL
ncbi:hypothetical protein [Corynebacterium flavescens]